ncbi:MAG: response regulator transcription factor, partial [Planctomycetota bacterium]|nr:response regulator transcription factor [Planctomycetota bacterium]
RPPHVLFVEDEEYRNDKMVRFLQAHGFAVTIAGTVTDAIAAASAGGYGCVLLDVMLPELDGFETCRQIRALNHGRVPIIMLTALDSDECRQRGFDAGADAYFTKPFNPDEVVSALHRLIQASRPPQI